MSAPVFRLEISHLYAAEAVAIIQSLPEDTTFEGVARSNRWSLGIGNLSREQVRTLLDAVHAVEVPF